MNVKQPSATPGLTGELRAIPPLALFLAVVAAMTVLIAASNWISDYQSNWDDPDSLMRLVEVRNWLGGQGWYDLHEYRLNPPDGVFMHWSRLVDLPIAAIILISAPFLGMAGGEQLAVNIWPPMTFALFLGGLGFLAFRFGRWPAVIWTLILLILSPAVTAVFQPGRIDHHNLQAALVVWMMGALVRADRSRAAGVAAGVLAALSLAIGMEMLMVVLVSTAGICGAWIWHGARFRGALIHFGLSLALATAFFFAATVDPDRWLVTACDAISLPYVALAGIGGAGIALAAIALPSADRDGAPGALLRGGMLIALACVLVVVTALFFPVCLGGPYAQVDPRLQSIWLDHVVEAYSIIRIASERPWLIPVHYAAPLISAIFCLITWRTMRSDDRPAFATAMAVILMSTLIGFLQQRGLVAAQTFGAAIGGVAVAHFRQIAGNSNRPGALMLRNSYLLLAPVAWYLVAVPFSNQKAEEAYMASLDSMASCQADLGAAMTGLAPGVVVTPVNIGAYLLMRTPHSVLSAPYHRNNTGLLTGDAILTAGDGRAEFDAAKASYVALCLKDSELMLYRDRAPAGLVARLQDGKVPDWLEPVKVTGFAAVYKRRKPAVARMPSPDDDLMTGSLPDLGLRPSLSF